MEKSHIVFTKMQGLGNDYLYIMDDGSLEDLPSLARRLSHRNFGVGSDGIVLVLPSTIADFRMRMFNADGSEAQMCGNAIRCLGRLVFDKGLTQKRNLEIETLAGIKSLELLIQEGSHTQQGKASSHLLRVNMGEPILEVQKIPVTFASPEDIPIDMPGFQASGFALSMGNPHLVFFLPEIHDAHVRDIGPRLERHEYFPERVNVEFVQVLSRSRIRMRVWERGSGETLACGTGACASVVAGISRGLLDEEVTVELLGGNLEVSWRPGSCVFQCGPAEYICEGRVEREWLGHMQKGKTNEAK